MHKTVGVITRRAYEEWERYLFLQKVFFPPLHLDCGDGTDAGFRIDARPEKIHITARREAGLLHGVFAYMRICELAGNRFVETRHAEMPAFETRMLWSWSRIAKGYRHAPYLRFESLINPRTMADPEQFPEMMRFIRHMARMGVNALAITHELHHSEIADFDQHGFRPFYDELRAFSATLASWGIDLYLYTASAPEPDFKRRVSDTDCSFGPRVQQFYHDFINEICNELPNIGGLLVSGGLGGYAGGSLYECVCEYCSSKTPLERVEKQIEVLSRELAKHGKQLVYTVTTDLPFTMDREVDAVLALMDKLPSNVILSFKDCYHDFEELRYPEHPLFSRLPEVRKAKMPLAVEYQLFPEMRGKGILLSSVVGVWAGMFHDAHRLGMRGVIGIIETHPDDAHPSMADWYAFGRLCWNPRLTEDELLSQWASLEYPREAVPALTAVLKTSFRAAGKLIYAKGVQNGSHGMIIPVPQFVRDILNDTWFPGAEKEPDTFVGSNKRQTWLYAPVRRAAIESDPELELFVHRRQVDAALVARLLDEKTQGLALYEKISAIWEEAEPFFSVGDYRFRELRVMIQRNVADARRFIAYFELFLMWQSKTLTMEAIRKAWKIYIGTGQDCSIYTSDTLFEAFLRHLGMILQGEDFDTHFESVYSLPQYNSTMKLWQITSIS